MAVSQRGPAPTMFTLNFTNAPGLGESLQFSQLLSIWAWADFSTETHAVIPPLGPYTVSLAGRDYVADTSFEPYRRDAFRHRSIPTQREGIQTTNIPGEGSVNPRGLWRRGAEDWLRGAGQMYYDRKLSVDNRFYRSMGINPWTQWQIELLRDTTQAMNNGQPITPPGEFQGAYFGDLKAMAAGNDVYILTQSSLMWTSDWNTYHTVTGLPTGCLYLDMATDGNNVYVTTFGGAHGIWQTVIGSTTATQLVTSGDFGLIRWVNQRIMVAAGNSIYNITSATPGPAPQPLYTHPTKNWTWVDFAYGSSQIYCAGGVPPIGPSSIFRTTIDPSDATLLLVPVQALPLEKGEMASALGTYLNFVFVGSNMGLRMCETLAAYDPTGNQGDLRAGALVPNITQKVTRPVTGIIGYDRFVFFAWNNYTDSYPDWNGPPQTGLGRLDLENFIDALTPTYASDLMVKGTRGDIWLDWDPITNSPLMSINGVQNQITGGIWTRDNAEYVESGSVDSGYITYDLPDDKVAMELDVEMEPPLFGSVLGQMSVDQPLLANYVTVGFYQDTMPPNIKWPLNQLRGKKFQVRFVLESHPDADNDFDRDATPTLGRWTLKSYPAISTGIDISVPLIMTRQVVSRDLLRPFDPYEEYEYLESLRQSQQVIQYVEGPFTRDVLINSLDWLPNLEQYGGSYSGFNAYLMVYMESLPN